MSTMKVELVSIEAPIWSGEASAVYAKTVEGEIGILPGHQPLLGALEPGFPVRIHGTDEELTVAVHGGFLFVDKNGVSVLAEQAERAEDIDVARAREALQQNSADGGPEEQAARLRAEARLRAAGEQV